MGLISRWRTKRRVQKQMNLLMEYIEKQLDAGVHPEDLLIYEISSEILWDVPLQSWKIFFDGSEYGIELGEGELIYLLRGRGGAEEHARVISALDRDGWYSVRFDVENR